jgi:hypothetical protein
VHNTILEVVYPAPQKYQVKTEHIYRRSLGSIQGARKTEEKLEKLCDRP